MAIDIDDIQALFSSQNALHLFPADRTNQFFDALLGDAQEGAYDIRLAYERCTADQLLFHFKLHQRPGKCLACHLTYGLPAVFERHPVINIQGLVDQLDRLMNGAARCAGWKLGATQEVTPQLHIVPLIIDLATG